MTASAPPPASRAAHGPAIAWLVCALIALAQYGNFYVYDSIGQVAELLTRTAGLSDTQIGMLNAIYSAPNVLLVVFGGILVDRFGAPLMFAISAICLPALAWWFTRRLKAR